MPLLPDPVSVPTYTSGSAARALQISRNMTTRRPKAHCNRGAIMRRISPWQGGIAPVAPACVRHGTQEEIAERIAVTSFVLAPFPLVLSVDSASLGGSIADSDGQPISGSRSRWPRLAQAPPVAGPDDY